MHVFIDTTDILRLEDANNRIKLQKIMFASVSHEFRTPLNAILNSYDFVDNSFNSLLNDILTEEDSKRIRSIISEKNSTIHRFIKMGKNSSQLLMGLIEDILDLSRMDSGTFKTNFTNFLIPELLDEIYDIFELQCSQKKIGFNINTDNQLKENEVCTDRGRVKQILLNLISNSFKFTFHGSISISSKLITDLNKTFIEFSVKDTGIGIKEEDQNKLFSLFGMISSTSNLNPNGCGIGLTVSKKYVEKLGGKIELKSVFGTGTIITFTVESQTQSTNIKHNKSLLFKKNIWKMMQKIINMLYFSLFKYRMLKIKIY